ncbi:hypothetical protein SSCG_03070 [Streptomyces clavuligerus]|nr:hypothetical protein SSCG_03070 [Streptomyces clavuligerus]
MTGARGRWPAPGRRVLRSPGPGRCAEAVARPGPTITPGRCSTPNRSPPTPDRPGRPRTGWGA